MKDALQMVLRETLAPLINAKYTHEQGLTFTVDYCHAAATEGIQGGKKTYCGWSVPGAVCII